MVGGPHLGARIGELVDQLAVRVSRSELHTALIESKLVDRQTQRSELKQRFPDPQAWARFVSEALGRPSTEALALRALSHVVQEFSRDRALDHRVDVAIRKAVTAAERNDVRKLQRELERLGELGKSGRIRELDQPVAIVYLAATTAAARRTIEMLDREEPANEQLTTLEAVVEEPNVSATSLPDLSAVPLAVLGDEGASAARLTILRERVDKVATLPREPSSIRWTRDALVDVVPRSPTDIDWPTTSSLSRRLREISVQLFEVPALLNIESLAPGDVVQFSTKLQQLEDVARSAAALRGDLDKYVVACSALVAKHPSVPSPALPEWKDAASLLQKGETFATGVSRVNDLLVRQRAEHEARVRAALEVVDAIADATKDLSERESDALRDRAKAALSLLDQDALILHATSAKVRAEELRGQREKQRSAASGLAKLLAENGAHLTAAQIDELVSLTKNRAELPQALLLAQAHVDAATGAPARPRTGSSPPILPAAPAVAAAPLALSLDGFTPRNRFSKIELGAPSAKPTRSAQAVISFLHQRAVDELRRGPPVPG